MPILETRCPECGTTLRSKKPGGFPAGDPVACPICETYFDPADGAAEPVAAARPARRPRDDDEDDFDDRPVRKKKKRRREDDEDDATGWQKYKKSPVRFVVLAVLLVVMAFLGWKLYEKKQREKEQNKEAAVMRGERAA